MSVSRSRSRKPFLSRSIGVLSRSQKSLMTGSTSSSMNERTLRIAATSSVFEQALDVVEVAVGLGHRGALLGRDRLGGLGQLRVVQAVERLRERVEVGSLGERGELVQVHAGGGEARERLGASRRVVGFVGARGEGDGGFHGVGGLTLLTRTERPPSRFAFSSSMPPARGRSRSRVQDEESPSVTAPAGQNEKTCQVSET